MPENNKVMFNGQTVMDISDSTVDANNMLAGTVGYSGAGVRTVGTATKGHTIKNPAGTSLTQRDNLKFSDGHISDDSTNNQTIVDIVKEVTTAQFANETERGLYRITDKPDSVINAEQVAYGSGNVKSALDNAFKSFDYWTLLSDFDTNNDTWIATNDGFLSVRATNVGATNGTYCYLYDTGLSSSVPISTIALPSGGGSLTYAQVIPVIKGHTYKMLMGGAISSVASYFLKINK